MQPPQWVRDECLRVARAVDCRVGVEVLQSTVIQSPLLCGLRRPRLLLPAAMCDIVYRADLPAILAHEACACTVVAMCYGTLDCT